MLSIVLCSLRVSLDSDFIPSTLVEYFKLENRLRCISNELKTFGVSFLEEVHITIVLLTQSLSFGLAQASVLVGNSLSLEQGYLF